MRHASQAGAILVVLAGAAVIGCGGGGGGSSTDTGVTSANGSNANGSNANGSNANGSTAAVTELRIELADSAGRGLGSDLRVGEQFPLRLYGRNSAGAIVVVSASDWSSSDSGVLVVGSSGTARGVSAGSATVSVRGGNVTQRVRVFPASAAGVTGLLRNQSGQGVPGGVATLYTAGGAVLSSTQTGSDGRFRLLGAASPNATFNLDLSARADRYLGYFGYGQNEFGPVCGSRRPLVGTLTAGQDRALAREAVALDIPGSGSPPPPPPDCGF